MTGTRHPKHREMREAACCLSAMVKKRWGQIMITTVGFLRNTLHEREGPTGQKHTFLSQLLYDIYV